MSTYYEIGVRGYVKDVEDFEEKFQKVDENAYRSRRESDDVSFTRHVYTTDEVTVGQVKAWTRYWSTLYPESVAYGYFRVETYDRSRGMEDWSITYFAYKNDELVERKDLATHEAYKAHFGETRSCGCETRRRNPLRSPYEDCPPRANPPTEWAVENIMYASEYMGRR